MKENINNFVWIGLRIGFFGMLLTWGLIIAFNFLMDDMIVGLILLVLAVFNFVLSIIHLRMFKKKILSIFALVVSSYLILTFLVGFIIGALIAALGILN